ncbi:MAG TPA: antitoxin VapB family protein [Candidatus Nanoarchaeia archaeon]|nr:antitoxin VapB family protein [Candidatus Nanoarchaeia archaeon]
MATKTITISEEAYNLLKNMKDERESFTDTIIKFAKRDPLSRLVGVLTTGEAEEMRKVISASRKKMNERVMQTAKRLN